MGEMST